MKKTADNFGKKRISKPKNVDFILKKDWTFPGTKTPANIPINLYFHKLMVFGDQETLKFSEYFQVFLEITLLLVYFPCSMKIQTCSKEKLLSWRQSYKINLVILKSKLVLNSLTVRYLNLDHNNTMLLPKLK